MRTTLSLILTLSLLAATGCDHKELSLYSVPSVDVRVEYDWSNAPEADPEAMTAVFFPIDEESSSPVSVVLSGKEGGMLRLAPTHYHAVSYNSDVNTWGRFRGTNNIDDYELYTQDVTQLEILGVNINSLPRSPSTPDERMAMTPQMIWNHHLHDFEIKAKSTTTQVITFTPEEAICYYDVTITNVKNLQYLKDQRLDATLSGMAEGFRHGSHTPTEVAVTMPFTLFSTYRESSIDTTIRGYFLTFGEPAGQSPVHTLSIYMMFNDGTAGAYHYDVTDQVRNAPDPRHVHIVVDGLTLPKPIVNGSGLHTSVDSWETEDHTIDM